MFFSKLPGTRKPTSFKWMDMVISNNFLYKDLVHHPIETTIYKQMFQVPGSYMDSSRKARIHLLSEYFLLFLINPMLVKGSKYKKQTSQERCQKMCMPVIIIWKANSTWWFVVWVKQSWKTIQMSAVDHVLQTFSRLTWFNFWGWQVYAYTPEN